MLLARNMSWCYNIFWQKTPCSQNCSRTEFVLLAYGANTECDLCFNSIAVWNCGFFKMEKKFAVQLSIYCIAFLFLTILFKAFTVITNGIMIAGQENILTDFKGSSPLQMTMLHVSLVIYNFTALANVHVWEKSKFSLTVLKSTVVPYSMNVENVYKQEFSYIISKLFRQHIFLRVICPS